MNTKHTPAPWTTAFDDKFQVFNANGQFENDARLIAAAPELLEVLKDIMRENHELGAISKPTADQARAAIAKATA